MGYFYHAMVTWSRLSSGFWTPGLVGRYGERIDRAIAVARDRIRDGQEDSRTYLYLGGALGFKGRLALMQRDWVSSFFLAMDAVEALKTSIRLDPRNKEVLLGLGIFDYYTARLPGAVRFISTLFIHRGDKKEGLRKLHVAAEEAVYSSFEAKSVLLHIYLFLEKAHFKALILAKDLADRFPDSMRFRYLEGVCALRLGKEAIYNGILETLRDRASREKTRGGAIQWDNRALYLEAAYLLFHERYPRARELLDRILERADRRQDPFMAVWPLLKRGMSYDIEGRRPKALRCYHRIMDLENGAGAQFLAEKYIGEAARRGDPFLGY
jgi:tetratricopeptide (TPR) repeat protein